MNFDGQLLPVLQVGDLTDTPYLRYGIPVNGYTTRAAVAARYSCAAVQPGAGVVLQILRIVLRSAATTDVQIRIMTKTEFDAAASVTAANGMADLASPQQRSLRPSRIITADLGSLPGLNLLSTDVPSSANGGSIIDLKPIGGIMLYGNDPGGPPVLGVMAGTANTFAGGAFWGREWPLPG